MSRRGRRGRSRTSAPEAPPERYVEHTLRSEDASINQPPVEPSRVATRQSRESPEDQRGMIECVLKLWAKTYDSTGDPEAGYLWLHRVSVLAIIW